MNNRFKFRFWCSSENRFITDCVIHGDGKISVKTGICGRDYCHDVVIQQYTGLTDSKDKEICEGDILKTPGLNDDAIGQVIYEADHGGYMFQWKWTKSKLYQSNYINLNCDVAFESVIVGNIFENPELLK